MLFREIWEDRANIRFPSEYINVFTLRLSVLVTLLQLFALFENSEYSKPGVAKKTPIIHDL